MNTTRQERASAKKIRDIVKENGGYMLYGKLDEECEFHVFPIIIVTGWDGGSLIQNNIVYAAYIACLLGYIENDGKGYKLIERRKTK